MNNLHAIPECFRDCVEHVGGCYEQHPREVKRLVQVIVAERCVLLRVQNFQQGRSGVPPEIATELVHLVQNEDRVIRACPFQGLHDLPRQSPYVGPAMAPDLGFIVHATHGDALELSAQCARNRATQRGLAYSGGPGKTENRALHGGFQLPHCQEIQNPVLYFLQIVMVFIQNLGGPLDVNRFAGRDPPGQRYHPFQPGPNDIMLG